MFTRPSPSSTSDDGKKQVSTLPASLEVPDSNKKLVTRKGRAHTESILAADHRKGSGHILVGVKVVLTSVPSVQHCLNYSVRAQCWLWGEVSPWDLPRSAVLGIVLTANPPNLVIQSSWEFL